MIRISGLTVVADREREAGPAFRVEYVLNGWSRKLPSSVNSAMSSAAASIAAVPRAQERQRRRRMFSSPVNSGWRPPPVSSSACTSPVTLSVPSVGARFRVISFRSVDLPAPLRPMIPSRSPRVELEVDAA